MNHKELLLRLHATSDIPIKQLEHWLEALPLCVSDLLKADEKLLVPGFGTFEVHKRLERVVENPATSRRTLTPPRLLLRFRFDETTTPHYTQHDLAKRLAHRRDIPAESALSFVEQCFQALHDAVKADGFASLKGFGTFHTPADTTTGITQTTFTAEEQLANLINRPFAELPEVELFPDTDLGELEAVNAEYANVKKEEPEHEQETPAPTTADTPRTTTIAEEKTSEHKGEADSFTSETQTSEDTEATEESTSRDTSNKEEQLPANNEVSSSDMYWRRTAIVFCIGFIGLLLFVLLRTSSPEVQSATEAPTAQPDTVTTDTTIRPAQRLQHITLNNPSEALTDYEPDGVLDEHTVEFGDILIRLAEHYYGNPYFVKYIISYNGLPASGEAAPGTVLKIPHLRKKPGL